QLPSSQRSASAPSQVSPYQASAEPSAVVASPSLLRPSQSSGCPGWTSGLVGPHSSLSYQPSPSWSRRIVAGGAVTSPGLPPSSGWVQLAVLVMVEPSATLPMTTSRTISTLPPAVTTTLLR